MRPLIDDVRLLDGRTTISNDQELLPKSLHTSQENKQETTEQLQQVDFQRVSEIETLAPGRVKNFIYLKDYGFLQDKQKQNRVKDFKEVDDLMDHLKEEPKEGKSREEESRSTLKLKN